MTSNRFIANYLKGDLGFITHILTVLCVATAFFTYRGASIEAETFLQKSAASIFALASGCAIYLFWHVTLLIVPGLKRIWQKIAACITVFFGCVMIFWLSSAFNVTGLAGGRALELHMSRYPGTLEQVLDKQFQHVLLIEGIVTDLRMEIARYDAAAKDEFNKGTYSGTPGPGVVVWAFEGLKKRLEGLAGEAEGFSKDVRKFRSKAQSRLEAMRKLMTSQAPLSQRMAGMERESDQLRSDIAQMGGAKFVQAVKRTLDALPQEVDLQSKFSANANTAARQKEALAKVRADVERTTKIMTAFLDQVMATSTQDIPPFEHVSAIRAVILYWPHFLPFWAGGLGVDIAPLFLVIFLVIALSTKTPAELVRLRIMNATTEDLLHNKVATDLLQRSAIDPKTLKALLDEIMGQDNDKTGGGT